MVLAVRPDVFHGIQFRRVRRQVLDIQTAVLGTDKFVRDLAPMGGEPVPNQQNVALDIAQQVLQELDNLFGLDGFLEDLKVEVPNG